MRRASGKPGAMAGVLFCVVVEPVRHDERTAHVRWLNRKIRPPYPAQSEGLRDLPRPRNHAFAAMGPMVGPSGSKGFELPIGFSKYPFEMSTEFPLMCRKMAY